MYDGAGVIDVRKSEDSDTTRSAERVIDESGRQPRDVACPNVDVAERATETSVATYDIHDRRKAVQAMAEERLDWGRIGGALHESSPRYARTESDVKGPVSFGSIHSRHAPGERISRST